MESTDVHKRNDVMLKIQKFAPDTSFQVKAEDLLLLAKILRPAGWSGMSVLS